MLSLALSPKNNKSKLKASVIPALVEAIQTHLASLRDAGAPLTLIHIRAIITSHIQQIAPQLLNESNSKFKCSDTFVHSFIRAVLNWVPRAPTKAARKQPLDWEDHCRDACYRLAWAIKQWDIPPELIVNMDQTNCLLAQGSSMTYAERGSHQISVTGFEEK